MKNLRTAAAVLALAACAAPARALEGENRVPQMIENRTFGFRVSNPEFWTAMKSKAGNVVMLSHPQKPREDFVTVNVEDLSKAPDVTPEDYKAKLVENLRKSIEAFEMRSDEAAVLDGVPGRELIYAGRLGGRPMRWKTLFTLKKRLAYVLTYAAQESDYFSNLESADKILYSFRFL